MNGDATEAASMIKIFRHAMMLSRENNIINFIFYLLSSPQRAILLKDVRDGRSGFNSRIVLLPSAAVEDCYELVLKAFIQGSADVFECLCCVFLCVSVCVCVCVCLCVGVYV